MAITVLNIMVAAVLPLWSTEIRRDKEEELIFRGLQYAEAIRVFQIRFQRLPDQASKSCVEVKPRCIRQLWKDPMTEDGKWGLIFQNQGNRSGQTPSPTPQTPRTPNNPQRRRSERQRRPPDPTTRIELNGPQKGASSPRDRSSASTAGAPEVDRVLV